MAHRNVLSSMLSVFSVVNAFSGRGARILSLGIALAVPAAALAQWTPQQSPTDGELRGLSVVSARVVWASGTRGRVVRTTDGGKTWTVDTIAGAESLDFRDVFALDAQRAWAMSSGNADEGQARIYRTTDGGKTWSLAYSTEQKGVFLDAIAFWDARHGIAMSDPVDGTFFLLTTSDGGATWTRVPPERLPPTLPGEAAFAASGTSLALAAGTHVWIGTGGGAKARVFHSRDRGRTWSVAETPLHAGGGSSGIFSVAFRDARRGVVVGGDYQQPRGAFPNVALTSDGGTTWRLAKGPLPPGYMSAVAYVPGTSTLVAVGLAGTARSTNGGDSWTMVDTVAYNSVGFANKSRGWAVGPRGRIAAWTRR
ncbi:MAG TPA: hypothetical protein VFZ21_23295 [Gemmatimonadaceae bacterium]|nr:hypothetical protein [Gemmatimonadaceae bacterium]